MSASTVYVEISLTTKVFPLWRGTIGAPVTGGPRYAALASIVLTGVCRNGERVFPLSIVLMPAKARQIADSTSRFLVLVPLL